MIKQVIVADDDADMRGLVRAVIRETDPRAIVHEAWNGQEALAQYLRFSGVTLVISDIYMRGMTGHDLACRIRKIEQDSSRPFQRTPIILTGGDASWSKARAREYGCDAYLKKPMDTNAMLETVSALL